MRSSTIRGSGLLAVAGFVMCVAAPSCHDSGGAKDAAGQIGLGGSAAGGSVGRGGSTAASSIDGMGGLAAGGRAATGGRAGTGGRVGTGGASGGGAGNGGGSGTAVATGGRAGTGGAGSGGIRNGGSTGTSHASGGAKGTGGATVAVDAGPAGLPYKGIANSPCAVRMSLHVAWYYNWTVTPSDTCAAGCEFVPMYSNHPNNNPTSDTVAAQIAKLVKAGYKYVLGFNEPNKSDQANMTVADALALWPAMTSDPSILVGSPATSADGQSWFEDFFSQAQSKGYRIDFIALHWYGWNSGSCDAKAKNLETYIQWAEKLPGNLPIWLTEWGCMNASNPDEATVQAFFEGAIAMLAKHPRVERYAWYPWNTNNHVANDDGSLTSLGTIFAAEPDVR